MKLLFYSILSFIFMSCLDHDRVHFRVAQPEWRPPILKFPERLQGEYLNLSSDDETIQITERYILNIIKYEGHFNRNELTLDSIIASINNDRESAENFLKEVDFDLKFKGDSIEFLSFDIDTVFNLSAGDVLKKYKRQYFISRKNEQTFWNVNLVNIKKDTIRLWQIEPTDELLKLPYAKLLDVKQNDDSEYILDPNKKEFKALLDSELFSKSKASFVKIK